MVMMIWLRSSTNLIATLILLHNESAQTTCRHIWVQNRVSLYMGSMVWIYTVIHKPLCIDDVYQSVTVCVTPYTLSACFLPSLIRAMWETQPYGFTVSPWCLPFKPVKAYYLCIYMYIVYLFSTCLFSICFVYSCLLILLVYIWRWCYNEALFDTISNVDIYFLIFLYFCSIAANPIFVQTLSYLNTVKSGVWLYVYVVCSPLILLELGCHWKSELCYNLKQTSLNGCQNRDMFK